MNSAPRAALIATGDELVLGANIDTNSAAIARRLADLGWLCTRFLVLGDDEEGLVEALRALARDHDAIVMTGGLGPTLDDVTRHAAARAAGTELFQDDAVLEGLRALFASRGRPFAVANERQALFPRGAEVLPNPNGSAPGFALVFRAEEPKLDRLRQRGTLLVALPGPPREMLPMLEQEVLPRLVRHVPRAGALARRVLYLIGLSESAFADQCAGWMERGANPLVGVTAKNGILSVTVRGAADTASEAESLADARADELAERFAAWLYSRDEHDLAFVVGRELIARKISIATAESCTGGLLAGRLTRVPGISAVFERGWVTYANAAKHELLGVSSELLARHGAVSREVAEEMARNAAERASARLALSVTGVAGPGGGTEEKPVGLVWFGVCLDGRVTTEERRFVVRGRELIREFAVHTALDLARRRLAT